MWSFHSGGLEAHASCRRLCIPTLSGIVEVDLVVMARSQRFLAQPSTRATVGLFRRSPVVRLASPE
jgi:hypothetical protein